MEQVCSPGWYPDPLTQGRWERYHDGTRWTLRTHPDGGPRLPASFDVLVPPTPSVESVPGESEAPGPSATVGYPEHGHPDAAAGTGVGGVASGPDAPTSKVAAVLRADLTSLRGPAGASRVTGRMLAYRLVYTVIVVGLFALATFFHVTDGSGWFSGAGVIYFGCWASGAAVYLLVSCVRRLHDIGRSAWWMLLALVPGLNLAFGVYLLVARSWPEANRWGPPVS